jgi:cytidyltransferase-like protein
MKIVLVHGTFDLLHLGHIRLFKEAAKLGRVVVTITADKYVTKRRLVFSQEERAEMIRECRSVSDVRIVSDATGIPAIMAVKPDIYVKGGDYAGAETQALNSERKAVERLGGKLRILTVESRWHSSELLSGKALA